MLSVRLNWNASSLWGCRLKGRRPSKQGLQEAYRMFFVQNVLVPPNRVRQPSAVGDVAFEHPHNIALTQVPLLAAIGRGVSGHMHASCTPAADITFH